MNELYHITPHENGRGFQMGMSTGTVDVPDNPGCYVISTGCGGGKTECAKSLIRHKHDEGIVYCVDTIDELEKMRDWILANLCNRPDTTLTESDVLIITSDKNHRDELEAYWDNPLGIMLKKVILLTHVRFFSELINLFLIYRPQEEVAPFNGNFENLMSRDDLRRYVIFDETPTFIKPFFSMPRAILGSFTAKTEDGSFICRPVADIVKYYTNFILGTPEDPFPKTNNSLNRMKKHVVFDMIPPLYPQWIATNRTGNLDITFRPADLCQPVMNTHVLILEGAADVLFQNGQRYQLIDVREKYNASVFFEPFPFDIRRREELDEEKFAAFIRNLRQRLKANQRLQRKTLVVVWKNSGEEFSMSDSGYYDRVKEELGRDKRLLKGSYSVIYFGSSSSKSTNEYRDYDEIILCGTWHIPGTDTSKFKSNYGTDTNNTEHILWTYIQLLSRIGIRKHDAHNYTVVFTDDYSLSFIRKLDQYFNHNTFHRDNIDVERVPDWLKDIIDNVRFGKKKVFTNELCKLIDYDASLREHLKVHQRYTLEITLDELYSIIPRHDKKRLKYRCLTDNLAKIGVELHIL